MASQKKNKKGKKVSLAEFLDSDSKLVTIRAPSNWSEIVDEAEEADAVTKSIIVNIASLPTAPRAAQQIDYSNISDEPPFVAYVANLSFQIDDESLRRIFADLEPKSARVLRDGARSRGAGIVEFEKRDQLIEALKRTDKELYGRAIRVTVSEKTDFHHDSGRSGYSHRFNNRTGGEERSGIDGTWERGGTRSDDAPDSRHGGGFNRDRQQRNDFTRQNNRGPRENHDSNNFGYGYPRKDERGGNRDQNNRPSQRFRQHDDDNRSNSGADRPRYGGRFSDTRDVRDRPKTSDEPKDDQQDAQRERPRLQLQPRTKPLDPEQTTSRSTNSTGNANDASISTKETSEAWNRQADDTLSNDNQQTESNEARSTENASAQKAAKGAGSEIFGGARPVDTLAKELEIEKKLKEMQMVKDETKDEQDEKPSSSRPSYRGGDRDRDRDHFRNKRSSQNEDHHQRDRYSHRREEGRSDFGNDYHHKREHSGGKQYEEDSRRRYDDDQHRRGGDRDRYGGPSRRDNDSARPNKYNQPNHSDRDQDRGHYRNRDRDNRHNDSNEFNGQGRSTNHNFSADTQPRNAPRGVARRTVPADDTPHRLQLSNKFGMLDDDALDADADNEEPQSPSIDS